MPYKLDFLNTLDFIEETLSIIRYTNMFFFQYTFSFTPSLCQCPSFVPTPRVFSQRERAWSILQHNHKHCPGYGKMIQETKHDYKIMQLAHTLGHALGAASSLPHKSHLWTYARPHPPGPSFSTRSLAS